MTKSISLITLLFLFAFGANAKIWRVNNNAGVDADFENITDALASGSPVAAGDTIHLEPSATNYSNATLTKPVVIIGPGYFLDPESTSQPYNPGLQADPRRAYLAQMTINTGAEGAKIYGVSFNNLFLTSVTGDIHIERCFIQSGISFNQSGRSYEGFTISKCFLSTISHSSGISAISQITIENCIFGDGTGIRLSLLSGNRNIIRNNVIHARYLEVPNSYFANNIYWYTIGGTSSDFTNAVVKNNIFNTNPTLPPTATYNLVSVNMNSVFVQGEGSRDSRYQLLSTSPAIGHGVTIAGYTPDAGAFGGPDPYRLSGIPPVPTIYSLTVPNSINPGDDLEVTFSTRSNN